MNNQDIFTYRTPTPVEPPKKKAGWHRIIVLVLGLIIVVELIIGARTLLTPVSLEGKAELMPLTEGSIALLTARTRFRVGDIVPVNIQLSTGGHTTSGTDVVLRFDPSVLEASAASFIKGDIYEDYQVVTIDPAEGLFRISGVVGVNTQGFNGVGNFGTVNLRAKSTGSPVISVVRSEEVADDSNIIEAESNTDVLGKVSSAKVIIQQ